MTTKPLVGSQAQRQSQSQRPLNTASIGRPSPHRSLSSTSTSRRHNENTIDLTVDVPDFAPARYGSSSRTGSRLKQELLNDPNGSGQTEIYGGGSSSLLSGRPPLPVRGRPQLHSDLQKTRPSNIGILPEQTHSHTSTKLMPLPVRPGRHPPPPLEKFNTSQTNHNKKDIRPKPYVLEVPAAAPTYTPNGMSMSDASLIVNHSNANTLPQVMLISFRGTATIQKISFRNLSFAKGSSTRHK
jgi:mediator of RNA polymerase II transcription subunit 12